MSGIDHTIRVLDDAVKILAVANLSTIPADAAKTNTPAMGMKRRWDLSPPNSLGGLDSPRGPKTPRIGLGTNSGSSRRLAIPESLLPNPFPKVTK